MMAGGLGDLYRNSFDRMKRKNSEKKISTTEEIIEKNKEVLNLSHGKGKRKKHKSKKK
jgi:hypothetical protein